MSKVIPIRQSGSVQEILCEAADRGLTELFVVGKNPDGTFWLKITRHNSVPETVGVIEMAKQFLLECMDEN